MNTCVLCFSRRNAFEWTIRSRSLWKGVRWSESGSGSSRTAGYERVASGERPSSCRSIRSRNEVRASWAMSAADCGTSFCRWRKGRGADVQLVQQKSLCELRLAASLERAVREVVRERVALLPRARHRVLELVDGRLALLGRGLMPVRAGRHLELHAKGLRGRGLSPTARSRQSRRDD